MMVEGSPHSTPLVYVLINKGVKEIRSGLNSIADKSDRFRLPPECRASMTPHQIRNIERSNDTGSRFLSGTWCKETDISHFKKGRKLTPLFMWYKNRLLPFGRNDEYFQEIKRGSVDGVSKSSTHASPVVPTENLPDTVPTECMKIRRQSSDNQLPRSTPQNIPVMPTATEDATFPGTRTEIRPERVTSEENLKMPTEISAASPPVIIPIHHLEKVPGTRKRRPRARGTHLNTDKKMWMSNKPRDDAVMELTSDGCSFDLSDVPKTSPSTGNVKPYVRSSEEDLLTQAFGYDPSVDAFCNMSTQNRHLEDVQLSVLGRQQVKFKMIDEDEYSIHGRGAFSTIYNATLDDTDVLVKDGTNRSVAEVMTEAKIISSLSDTCISPQLLGVLEQGFLEREYSLVLEDSTGFISLRDLLHSGYFVSRSGWTNICLTLSSHLMALHKRRILHNNISADNIIINKDTLEVKLVGFGQASFGRGVKLPRASRHHSGLAPEVRLGCVTSPQADVYALGSVLEEIKVTSHLMDMHEVIQMCHQGLPRNRPQALDIHDLMQAAFHMR